MYESENTIRERIRELKEYYTNVVIYGVVIFACLIIWMTTGGPFWPIWVIVALGAVALLKGIRLGLFPKLSEIFPFLRSDWEEEQIRRALEEKIENRNEKKDD
ncbi:MAG: 2TM domain-containing protein [Candidatus Paracaedibacteraceae bacterium]|nr:2TM domain-containing protein [Candidatus Paracaedibacteraceae bacterium]